MRGLLSVVAWLFRESHVLEYFCDFGIKNSVVMATVVGLVTLVDLKTDDVHSYFLWYTVESAKMQILSNKCSR